MTAGRLPGRERWLAVAARAGQGLAWLGALALLTWRYDLPTQAMFFVFLSLGAIVQLGDMGLASAALTTASHLAAEVPPRRLPAFCARARRLNVGLSLLAAVVSGTMGGLLFTSHADGVNWLGPGLACLLALMLSQAANLEIALVDGTVSSVRAWKIRALQEAFGGAVLLSGLALGAGLWSLAGYWGARAVVVVPALGPAHRASAPAPDPAPSFDWRREVWPFQWRVGLSALSGFLIFQAINPLLLAQQGSEAAGRFGLSLAVMNMLLMASTAWPSSQSARFGHLLATGRIETLRAAFVRTLLASTALALAMAVAVLLALHGLQSVLPSVARRVADLPTTAALLSAGLLHHVVMVIAVLLRAERREPLLTASIVGGLSSLLAMGLAASHGTLLAPALAHVAMATLGLAWSWVHFQSFSRRVLARPAHRGAPT